MARPRSEDKRNALLAAAVRVFAEDGINAPTARIAKVAGVAASIASPVDLSLESRLRALSPLPEEVNGGRLRTS